MENETSFTKKITLESLACGIPVLPDGCERGYIQKCMVCLDHVGHSSGVSVAVKSRKLNIDDCFVLEWRSVLTEQIRLAHNDLVRSTEDSACAMAFIVIRERTEYTTISQAKRNGGYDYYLGLKNDDSNLIFNNKARLEVSGILHDKTGREIEKRLKQKIQRIKDDAMPAFVFVFEHKAPTARLEMK